jgi:hypothetical protein
MVAASGHWRNEWVDVHWPESESQLAMFLATVGRVAARFEKCTHNPAAQVHSGSSSLHTAATQCKARATRLECSAGS